MKWAAMAHSPSKAVNFAKSVMNFTRQWLVHITYLTRTHDQKTSRRPIALTNYIDDLFGFDGGGFGLLFGEILMTILNPPALGKVCGQALPGLRDRNLRRLRPLSIAGSSRPLPSPTVYFLF
jgi:hypothetical protein